MAFRASLPLLHGKVIGRSRTSLQPSLYARNPSEVMRQFQLIKQLARQNGTVKRVFQIQRREFPTDRRKWNAMDRAYFRKWHHLKYCTQVIKYSVTRGLSFISAVEKESFRAQKEWAEDVKTDSFGSGRLLKHHLHEVRMDPKDKQWLRFNELEAKLKGESNATLLRIYWNGMPEVRYHREREEWVTLEELKRFSRSSSEIDVLRRWDMEMKWAEIEKVADKKETEPETTAKVAFKVKDRVKALTHIPYRTSTGYGSSQGTIITVSKSSQGTITDVAPNLRVQWDAEKEVQKMEARKRDIAMTLDPETKKRTGFIYPQFESNFNSDKQQLLMKIFKHTMELVGSRTLPKPFDNDATIKKKNRAIAIKEFDRGFSVEELRRLAHGHPSTI